MRKQKQFLIHFSRPKKIIDLKKTNNIQSLLTWDNYV